MYNLIVTAEEGAWSGAPYDFDVSRFGEHTDPNLLEQYKKLDEHSLARLLTLPTIFAYETFRQSNARVGHLTRVRVRQRLMRIEYAFDDTMPPISPDRLLRAGWELDIGEWEMNRTHWALKSVDLIEALSEAGFLPRISARQTEMTAATPLSRTNTLVVRPTAFAVPPQQVEATLVAVMMPFGQEYNEVYEAIRGACADAAVHCTRVDDIWQESVIVQDIFNLLVRSRVVVVDFSGRNPNVMYETGIAHTLGREVVPLCQSADDVPFDLRHHRYLKYEPTTDGLAKMRQSLSQRLATLAARPFESPEQA